MNQSDTNTHRRMPKLKQRILYQKKFKLGSAERMVTWLEDGAAATGDSEILFRFMAKTPGWNEKNFQVGSTMEASQWVSLIKWFATGVS
jgi:hypothetical protein